MKILITENRVKKLISKLIDDLPLPEWSASSYPEQWEKDYDKRTSIFYTKNSPAIYYSNKSKDIIYLFTSFIKQLSEDIGLEPTDEILIQGILEWFNVNNPMGVKASKVSMVSRPYFFLNESIKDDIMDRLLDKIKLTGRKSLYSDEENYLTSNGDTRVPVVDMTDQEIIEFFERIYGELHFGGETLGDKLVLTIVDEDGNDVITVRRTLVIIEGESEKVCNVFGLEEGQQRLLSFFNDRLSEMFKDFDVSDWEKIDKIMIDGCELQNIELEF